MEYKLNKEEIEEEARKQRIKELLKKVIKKYEADEGQRVITDQKREHYEGVAKKLTEVSNRLTSLDSKRFPHQPAGCYDISISQFEAAYNGKVKKLKLFIAAACYIYLYDGSPKDYEKELHDLCIIDVEPTVIGVSPLREEIEALKLQVSGLEQEKESLVKEFDRQQASLGKTFKKKLNFTLLVSGLAIITAFVFFLLHKREWETIKKDMKIVPYQPTQAQIDSLEGIWLVYTGSPQARRWDNNRFHMVVPNLVEVSYKSGYFVFDRYGPSFDQKGYMQFEAPHIVSIHSYFKNDKASEVMPKHSLMSLDSGKRNVNVISAGWNFDKEKNLIIGIREVYIKQGKGGSLNVIKGELENTGFSGKIIHWHKGTDKVGTFNLRNISLKSLADTSIRDLLDHKSIILKELEDGLIITPEMMRSTQKQ